MKLPPIPLTLVLGATLGLTTSRAQENPPERLDTITLKHQTILHSAEPVVSGYAVIWTSSGFGTVELDDQRLPRVWRLKDASGSWQPYTWFRITNPTDGSLDDYWFCEPSVWDAFSANGNVTQLKSDAWHFKHYHQSSTYTPPVILEPITWEERTPHLTIGYVIDNTLIVVKRNDTTPAWEWSVRGAKGQTGWAVSADQATARSAAEARWRRE